ncbi:MAG: hypothetical protein H8E05_00200 [Bacteroidetes bacterium]|nr:hypothetical protein [Bacteroidota bacterium]
MTNTLENLKTAILKHMDCVDDEDFRNTMRDVSSHGADGGVPSFTYTKDCVDFYEDNEDYIYELANETAENMGYDSVIKFISDFNNAYMADSADGHKNLLAWFALEEVARWMEDEKVERLEN